MTFVFLHSYPHGSITYYSSLALYLVQLPPLLSLSPLLSLLVKKFSSIFEVGVAGLLKVGLIFFQCLELLVFKNVIFGLIL